MYTLSLESPAINNITTLLFNVLLETQGIRLDRNFCQLSPSSLRLSSRPLSLHRYDILLLPRSSPQPEKGTKLANETLSLSFDSRRHARENFSRETSPLPVDSISTARIRPRREGEEEIAARHRTIHAAGVSRCGPRPNEFARMQSGAGRADFCRLAARSVQFALHLLQIGFPSFLARAHADGGWRPTRISHEKRGRIPSQSDNPGLSRAISVIDEPLQ